MGTPESYIRNTRTLFIVHAEAFQVMLYRAEDGSEVWFWNSRDGVTPFGTTIDGKMYRHAMNDYLPTYMSALPDRAQYVWVTYTPETWRAMEARKFEALTARQDKYGDDFRDTFPILDDWLAVFKFEHGQPQMMTRKEFLAGTPEWMGGCRSDG